MCINTQREIQTMQTEKLGYSIDQFCLLHSISRGTLYNFWKAGVGPRWMAAGGRRLISAEAAAEWRREREAAAQQQPQRVRVAL